MPIDPLNSDQARNRFTNLFAHGSITSITLRLRYLSIFAWALRELPDESEQSEESEEFYRKLKNIEKIFGLSSRYRQLEADHSSEALRGMDGNTRFDLDWEEFDFVNLDEIELLKNDSYAYEQFYENQLQNYLLKRGGFELTEAGEELGALVQRQLGEDGEAILESAVTGGVDRSVFESISKPFANQSVYLEPDLEDERQALTKIILGFVEWSGDRHSGSVQIMDELPEGTTLDVLDHLYSTLDTGALREAGASKLYQKYHRGYFRYRRAHSCFLILSLQKQASTDDSVALSDSEARQFEQYRELMQLYWLQVYGGFAVESQLEALSTFLNSRIPPRYPYDHLLDQLIDESRISREFSNVVNGLQAVPGSDQSSPAKVTSDLMMYGRADLARPEVNIAEIDPSDPLTLGAAMRMIDSTVPADWDAAPAVAGVNEPNEVLLSQAIQKSLTNLMAVPSDERAQFDHWAQSIARSIALLLLVITRFERIKDEREWLFNYGFNRFDNRFASISELTRFVTNTEDDTPLHGFAHDLVERKVVETHLKVFYDRLRPGNVKRGLSFDQDERLCLEVDVEHGTKPFAARPHLVRFNEMCTLLRDAGLLSSTDDGYQPTSAGADKLARLTELDS